MHLRNYLAIIAAVSICTVHNHSYGMESEQIKANLMERKNNFRINNNQCNDAQNPVASVQPPRARASGCAFLPRLIQQHNVKDKQELIVVFHALCKHRGVDEISGKIPNSPAHFTYTDSNQLFVTRLP